MNYVHNYYYAQGMVDFSNKGNNNSLMTSGTFDGARISQIISKTFHALCNLTSYKFYR